VSLLGILEARVKQGMRYHCKCEPSLTVALPGVHLSLELQCIAMVAEQEVGK